MGFPSEEAMVDFLMFANSTVNNTADYLGGVVFTNTFERQTVFPDDISYKIRLSATPRDELNGRTWHTALMFPIFQTIGPRDDNRCGGNPGIYDVR